MGFLFHRDVSWAKIFIRIGPRNTRKVHEIKKEFQTERLDIFVAKSGIMKIISDQGWIEPTSYADAFSVFAENNVIDAESVKRLKSA